MDDDLEREPALLQRRPDVHSAVALVEGDLLLTRADHLLVVQLALFLYTQPPLELRQLHTLVSRRVVFIAKVTHLVIIGTRTMFCDLLQLVFIHDALWSRFASNNWRHGSILTGIIPVFELNLFVVGFRCARFMYAFAHVYIYSCEVKRHNDFPLVIFFNADCKNAFTPVTSISVEMLNFDFIV